LIGRASHTAALATRPSLLQIRSSGLTLINAMGLPSSLRRFLALAAGSMVLMSCAKADGQWVELNPESPGTGPELPISGTVRHLRIEGGLFVIDAEDGARYNPLNLPAAFRVDGKQIEAVGRRRDDAVSIGMVGPIVELIRIRERRAGNPSGPLPGGDGERGHHQVRRAHVHQAGLRGRGGERAGDRVPRRTRRRGAVGDPGRCSPHLRRRALGAAALRAVVSCP